MRKKPDELPEAVGGVEGESDVVAERSGARTPRTRRPVPADLPEDQEEPQQAEEPEDEDDDVTRPDAGPTG
ncbi:MAG TPA: hypothetical protein VFV66_31535 [Nonomuraea sp.]|nr:hypothetical protein [Nonomuraea sp.]